jgi:hypothetical protein
MRNLGKFLKKKKGGEKESSKSAKAASAPEAKSGSSGSIKQSATRMASRNTVLR